MDNLLSSSKVSTIQPLAQPNVVKATPAVVNEFSKKTIKSSEKTEIGVKIEGRRSTTWCKNKNHLSFCRWENFDWFQPSSQCSGVWRK